ncbi:MAG: hypothetical protein FWD01_02450, partial [Defluviitaleaceae bacterium]|nr:hypothetical protein [Defluviitaleaceae bacterium]
MRRIILIASLTVIGVSPLLIGFILNLSAMYGVWFGVLFLILWFGAGFLFARLCKFSKALNIKEILLWLNAPAALFLVLAVLRLDLLSLFFYLPLMPLVASANVLVAVNLGF